MNANEYLLKRCGAMYKIAGRSLLIIIVILLSVSCKKEWKEYTSKNGGFSVSFPGTPRDTFFLAGVALQNETFIRFYGDEINSYFKVNYIDFPVFENPLTGKKMDPCGSAKMFNKIDMENYALQLGGTLRTSSAIVSMSAVESEEFKVDFKDRSGVVTVRKLCNNGRLYTIMVITRSGAENNEDAMRFFNSFKTSRL